MNITTHHLTTDERVQAAANHADSLRARTYGLLATLLYAPPTSELLTTLRTIANREPGQDQPVAMAWEALRLSASAATVAELDDEFHDLFIGLGRGEVVPYASWYLTGFLMEKPLAALRHTLGHLGIERQAHVYEPEDHAAALCEFFRRHAEPWMGRFFGDLQQSKSARFYRVVGQLGEHFVDFERNYLLESYA